MSKPPRKKFIGYIIPVNIVILFERKTINLQEMFLWSMIRALTDYENSRPCYASRAYFAEKLNLSEDRVTRLLSHLRSLGLIEDVGFDGRKRQMIAISPQRLVKKTKADSVKTTRLTRRKQLGDNKVDNKVDNKREESKDSSLSRVSRKRGLGLVDDPPDELAVTLSKKLIESIKRENMLPPRSRITAWIKVMKVLINDYGGEEVSQVVEWYSQNVCKEMVPEAFYGKSFKLKYLNIKRAMQRDKGPEDLEISDKAKQAALRVEGAFPPGDRESVEKLIQISFDRFTKFRKDCQELLKEEPKLQYLLENILETIYPLQEAENHAIKLSQRRGIDRQRLWRWAFRMNESYLNQFRDWCSSDKMWKKFQDKVMSK